MFNYRAFFFGLGRDSSNFFALCSTVGPAPTRDSQMHGGLITDGYVLLISSTFIFTGSYVASVTVGRGSGLPFSVSMFNWETPPPSDLFCFIFSIIQGLFSVRCSGYVGLFISDWMWAATS